MGFELAVRLKSSRKMKCAFRIEIHHAKSYKTSRLFGN